MDIAAVAGLGMMERVGGAELCELLEEMEGYTPLPGVRDARYAKCVSAADVTDDGFVVGECDHVAGGNDVVDAYERGRCGIGLAPRR
jgi:hypothetical protein